MAILQIITNNPAVVNAYPDEARFRETDVSGVFAAVRDMVHMGAALVSHPLSGSVKPWESPYKSVAVSPPPGSLCLDSLDRIESAIGMLRGRGARRADCDARALEDFAAIDLDIIKSAMESAGVVF